MATSAASYNLVELAMQCKARGITLQMVADEARALARTGTTSIYTVSRVFHGRATSANVLAAAERLLAMGKRELRKRKGRPPGRPPGRKNRKR